jgi:hypothetical protein
MTQQIAAKESEQKMQVTKHATNLSLTEILGPKLLHLVLAQVSKQAENPQIEFIHYTLEIVNICIQNKELRDSIMDYELPSLIRHAKNTGDVSRDKNWIEYLRMLEKHD